MSFLSDMATDCRFGRRDISIQGPDGVVCCGPMSRGRSVGGLWAVYQADTLWMNSSSRLIGSRLVWSGLVVLGQSALVLGSLYSLTRYDLWPPARGAPGAFFFLINHPTTGSILYIP